MLARCKGNKDGYLDMPRRSYKVLPLSEKEKVYHRCVKIRNHYLVVLGVSWGLGTYLPCIRRGAL
jgi:hypothetical protein